MRGTGTYVATIRIDFDFDDELPGIKPFEEIKKSLEIGEVTDMIQSILQYELDLDLGEVHVEQEFAEIMKQEV